MKNTLIIYFFFFIILNVSCINNWKNKNEANISGMGASFPHPFYGIIFENYLQQTGKIISDNATGSGNGMRALQDKTVDFAGSDAIPTKKEFSEFKKDILLIPTCLGGLVITYNLPGVEDLKLDGTVLAEIFMNKIQYWDNEAIQKQNPEKELPHQKIVLVYRSNGSGSSFVLSDYLSKVSSEWNKKMGRGKSFNWGKGVSAKNSSQLAFLVSQTEGSIGYTSAEHADIFNLSQVALKNSHNEYIKYNKESVLAATDFELPDYPVMITNSPNKNAYPLSCYSWILVYKNQAYNKRTQEKYNSLKDFLSFLISEENQNIAGKLNYVPLPENALNKAKKLISTMEWKESE